MVNFNFNLKKFTVFKLIDMLCISRCPHSPFPTFIYTAISNHLILALAKFTCSFNIIIILSSVNILLTLHKLFDNQFSFKMSIQI